MMNRELRSKLDNADTEFVVLDCWWAACQELSEEYSQLVTLCGERRTLSDELSPAELAQARNILGRLSQLQRKQSETIVSAVAAMKRTYLVPVSAAVTKLRNLIKSPSVEEVPIHKALVKAFGNTDIQKIAGCTELMNKLCQELSTRRSNSEIELAARLSIQAVKIRMVQLQRLAKANAAGSEPDAVHRTELRALVSSGESICQAVTSISRELILHSQLETRMVRSFQKKIIDKPLRVTVQFVEIIGKLQQEILDTLIRILGPMKHTAEILFG